jgi:hypothetical protein
MAKRAILYIDLLGVQKLWASGGADEVRHRLVEFNEFITDQITFLSADLHREGDYTVVLAGDSVSVICEDFRQAIGIGTHLFTQAFYDTKKRDRPLWFRGAIGGWHNQYLTVNTKPITARGIHVGTQYQMENDYLGVLALEKSGFKGMRLLVSRRVIDDRDPEYQRDWPCPDSENSLGIVTRLHECTYPEDEYADVLWMADAEQHYRNLKKIMASRFKKATFDPDELVQAAWTRAVFDQVDSLIWSVQSSPRVAAAVASSSFNTPTGSSPVIRADGADDASSSLDSSSAENSERATQDLAVADLAEPPATSRDSTHER